MTRKFAVVLASALAIAGAVLFITLPTTKVEAASSASATKVCRAKTTEGKTKTWRCGKDQACCVNATLGLYVCGYPGLGCL